MSNYIYNEKSIKNISDECDFGGLAMPDESHEPLNGNPELEYKALRDELLIRFRLRQQIVTITLTITGALLGLSLAHDRSIALVIPPVTAYLALGWATIENRIHDLSLYIRNHLEPELIGKGWEHYIECKRIRREQKWGWKGSIVFHHGGLFLIAQFIAIILGTTVFNNSLHEKFFIGIDVLSVIFVFWIFWQLHVHVKVIRKEQMNAFKMDLSWLP